MAELAAGAVTSLLGVIRSEARLLRHVGGDVQFIKEEMESMNSFLAHLARSAPPGGEHDDQVRTWMNQVRVLAQDCNSCIDLYRYRRNPDIHRARGGLRRHLWWVHWFLHKLAAQHRAAIRLRELKDRARDVGERRLRYGVEVPSKSTTVGQPTLMPAASSASSSSAQAASPAAAGGGYAYAAADEEEDGDDQLLVADSGQRALLSRTPDGYVKTELFKWMTAFPLDSDAKILSFAIVAPDDTYFSHVLKLAYETMIFSHSGNYIGYNRAILIDIPALHLEFLPLGPKEILCYILHELKREKSQSQKQGIGSWEEGENEDLEPWRVYSTKFQVYLEKKRMLNKIKESIEKMKIYEKLDMIQSYIQTHQPPKGQQRTKGMDQQDPDVHVLLKQLFRSSAAASQPSQLKNNVVPKLSVSDKTISAVAKKLKEHMEADAQGGGGIEEVHELGGKQMVEEEREGGGVEKEVIEEDGGGGGNETLEEEHGRGVAEEEHKGEGGGGVEKEIVEEQRGEGEDEKDEDDEDDSIYLHDIQYVHILRQVFPKTSGSNRSAAKQATNTMLGEDYEIKQTTHELKQDDKVQETGEPSTQVQNTDANFTEIIKQKMDKIKQEFKEQLKIKGLVDNIKNQLKNEKCPLIILKVDETVEFPTWEDIRNALLLLGSNNDVLILTTAKNIKQAKECCYPQREPIGEPIDYSPVGLYYDTVVQITSKQKHADNYDPHVFRNILEECEPHEFCMKIFAHSLYVNPKRSNEQLRKLHGNLQASPKSFDAIAKKMFKFSYTDMPKEYMSCLLYLAIFPPGHKIRRSTLIERWVAEGLIFKEDWSSSVHQANLCFDELIDRWLAYPADTSTTGRVSSCMVGDLVHGFITKIARKQHIVEKRLSIHLARHFSIFNDIQLRSSDRIDEFFRRSLYESSRVSLLKVLDLEGCQCFGGKNQHYLDDICSKLLLLKYLSLRRTDVPLLPSKINNLLELEVLDIRETKVPMNATANILLLKLKRLLAGNANPSSSNSAVRVPHKIEKMVNMEVLSNVKAWNGQGLKDIGKLWQLRKLGVVIDDKSSHLKNLFLGISDLQDCLCSLSITLPMPRSGGTPSREELPDGRGKKREELPECGGKNIEKLPKSLGHPPKLLESLSISGATQKCHLLPLFAKDVNNKLVKVTLSSTSLNQDNLDVLAKLRTLQFVRLRHITCTESTLTFMEDEFISLKCILVEESSWTEIIFEYGAAPQLEKLVLSLTNIESVYGVWGLERLEEVELSWSRSSNNNGRLISSFKDAENLAKMTLRGTSLEQGDQHVQNRIAFDEDEFPKLKLLIVDCSAITEIAFASGSAPKLEKIVWSSFTSLSGINNLPRLKELEFNGDSVPPEVEQAIKNHKNKLHLKYSDPEARDQAKVDEEEDDDHGARFPFCWKKQV